MSGKCHLRRAISADLSLSLYRACVKRSKSLNAPVVSPQILRVSKTKLQCQEEVVAVVAAAEEEEEVAAAVAAGEWIIHPGLTSLRWKRRKGMTVTAKCGTWCL
jgi:hypothetical protein